MISTFPEIITAGELERLKELIVDQSFVSGAETAGEKIRPIKRNEQVSKDSDHLPAITGIVLDALKRNASFCNAFYPRQLHSVLVSRYRPGMAYGQHVDGALMGHETAWRTDLSLTLFLNEPSDYDGGELEIEWGSTSSRIKLPERSLVCYSTSNIHQVTEVTRGERLALVGWIQSFVRDPQAREILADLAESRDKLLAAGQSDSRSFQLVNKSHANLLRRWAET